MTTIFRVERDGGPSNALFLRALRLSVDPETGQARPLGMLEASAGARGRRQAVGSQARSAANVVPNHDEEIRRAADRWGIPFQFLKAQAQLESSHGEHTYRVQKASRSISRR